MMSHRPPLATILSRVEVFETSLCARTTWAPAWDRAMAMACPIPEASAANWVWCGPVLTSRATGDERVLALEGEEVERGDGGGRSESFSCSGHGGGTFLVLQ